MKTTSLSAFLSLALCCASVAQAVTIDWITVGNPGNAGEVQSQGTFGAVAYTYRIGATEVTNDQYTEFLNAVAASDPNSVWNQLFADISRSGSDGSYIYSVNATLGPNPVRRLSYVSAMRFVNWLDNGQPTGAQGAGTTEDGTYAISDGFSETRG